MAARAPTGDLLHDQRMDEELPHAPVHSALEGQSVTSGGHRTWTAGRKA